MPDKLSDSDLELIRSAYQAKQQAEATYRFIAAHMNRVYNITPGTTFRMDTGEITRQAE